MVWQASLHYLVSDFFVFFRVKLTIMYSLSNRSIDYVGSCVILQVSFVRDVDLWREMLILVSQCDCKHVFSFFRLWCFGWRKIDVLKIHSSAMEKQCLHLVRVFHPFLSTKNSKARRNFFQRSPTVVGSPVQSKFRIPPSSLWTVVDMFSINIILVAKLYYLYGLTRIVNRTNHNHVLLNGRHP